jgi:hypothetical protein
MESKKNVSKEPKIQKDLFLQIRVTKEQKDKIHEIAKSKKLSVTQLILDTLLK